MVKKAPPIPVPLNGTPCPSCGTPVAPGAKFCPRCGTPLGAPPAAPVTRTAGGTVRVKVRARVSAVSRDGSASAVFDLSRDETTLGRTGEVKLDHDPYIAPKHARFVFRGEQLYVTDESSVNGVFLQLRPPREQELPLGAELRLGRQLLRVAAMPDADPVFEGSGPLLGSPDPGYGARFEQILEGGEIGDIFPLREGDNLIGRAAGDVSFPSDGYVSSRHANVKVKNGAVYLKDLGSANGTFVRVRGQSPVATGDMLLVGEQLLRIDPA